jgi:hypothetical protein
MLNEKEKRSELLNVGAVKGAVAHCTVVMLRTVVQHIACGLLAAREVMYGSYYDALFTARTSSPPPTQSVLCSNTKLKYTGLTSYTA